MKKQIKKAKEWVKENKSVVIVGALSLVGTIGLVVLAKSNKVQDLPNQALEGPVLWRTKRGLTEIIVDDFNVSELGDLGHRLTQIDGIRLDQKMDMILEIYD